MTGFILRPVEDLLHMAIGTTAGTETAEQAVAHGLLGGFRAAAADLMWLRASEAAADRDLPAVESLLQLVTVLDPRPQYFWLNGARILAYDLPVWRIAAAGGSDRVSVATQQRIMREQVERALRRLDAAMRFHPASAALWIERANLQLNQLRDMAGAAESYRRAWEQPNAPYFAARLHAELLRRLGRKAEALAWLVKLHPQLPPDDEAAGADLVLSRIRDLEKELKIPTDQAQRPL